MKKSVIFSVMACAASLLVNAPLAMAHDRSGVNWSINIGSSFPPPVIYTNPPPVIYTNPPPVVYVPAQPVYVPPQTYVQPHPTYIIPQPIYVQPAPVVRFGGNYYDNRRNDHRYGDHEQRQFQSHGPYGRRN